MMKIFGELDVALEKAITNRDWVWADWLRFHLGVYQKKLSIK